MNNQINNQNLSKIYTLLRVTFISVPIIAGADKFLNLLTDWAAYISPILAGLLPMDPSIFMMIVGIVEIIAGLLVFFNPKIGGYIVSLWLVLISLSLVFTWHHVDVAVRDLLIAEAAYILAYLSPSPSNNSLEISPEG